jgi:histone-lysine N-methyltransferase SETMAR
MLDHRITTRIITYKLGISKGSVQTILKEDLNMGKLCAKIVPKILTQEQRRCVACCRDRMKNEEGSNFLQRVITGDEAWIYEYDPETKRQSEEWKHCGSPRSKKACKSHSKIKIMLNGFWGGGYSRSGPSRIWSMGSDS